MCLARPKANQSVPLLGHFPQARWWSCAGWTLSKLQPRLQQLTASCAGLRALIVDRAHEHRTPGRVIFCQPALRGRGWVSSLPHQGVHVRRHESSTDYSGPSKGRHILGKGGGVGVPGIVVPGTRQCPPCSKVLIRGGRASASDYICHCIRVRSLAEKDMLFVWSYF